MDVRGIKQKQVFRVVEQLYMGVQLRILIFGKCNQNIYNGDITALRCAGIVDWRNRGGNTICQSFTFRPRTDFVPHFVF